MGPGAFFIQIESFIENEREKGKDCDEEGKW